MIIENITFLEYTLLYGEDRDRYDFSIRYDITLNTPVDHLEFGDFFKLPCGLIKDTQESLGEKSLVECLENFIFELKNIDKKEVARFDLIKFCQIKSYFVDQMKTINEVENISLGSTPPTDKQIRAGINEFQKLGNYLQFSDLCGGDILKFDQIRKLPYELFFLELLKRKIKSDYENNLFEIERRELK